MRRPSTPPPRTATCRDEMSGGDQLDWLALELKRFCDGRVSRCLKDARELARDKLLLLVDSNCLVDPEMHMREDAHRVVWRVEVRRIALGICFVERDMVIVFKIIVLIVNTSIHSLY